MATRSDAEGRIVLNDRFITWRLRQLGKTKRELAVGMGIAPETLSRKLSGDLAVNQDDIHSLADALQILDTPRLAYDLVLPQPAGAGR